MSVFTIGDLHLSLASDKPMDKFRGWENYVERLRENWSASVTPDDTVILPGDLSWAMSLDESKTDLAFLNELNGTKILLKGNHDYWWNTVSKMNA
ncbi:MAG: metallophosphoesterase, partial [Clostridia bacterium]|nr:metallophosphoesterase [Clostridia bacterium]